MIKAILFDCDGVLVDSEIVYVQSLQQFLKTLNLQASIDFLSTLVGAPGSEIFAAIQKKFNTPYETAKLHKMHQDFHQKFYANKELEPIQGIEKFVKAAYEEEFILAIGSSSPKTYVEAIAERLGITPYISCIVTKEDVERSKPFPDIYLKILADLGITSTEAIVIEDSKNGIQAAKNAAIRVIGFKGSSLIHDTSEADIEVDSFEEISLSDLRQM